MSLDRFSRLLIAAALAAPLPACSEAPATTGDGGGGGGGETSTETGCAADADCAATPEAPLCDIPSGECIPLPPGHPIGWKDGSPSSVAFTMVFEPEKLRVPWDLAFNPSKPAELWVVNYKDDSVYTIQNPGTPEMTSERRRDPAASHFMDAPPAIAFGVVLPEWGQTWGVCGDNDNSANGGTGFMGPALFSADPAIFAKPTPEGLGSHLDMLHSSSFCRGIAHVDANTYFVFNADEGSLDWYDFKADHGPGKDDHSDGEILRYVEGSVAGVDGVPSHLVYDPTDAHVYAADTGNKRIVKLDTKSGTVGSSFGGFEDVVVRKRVDGAVLTDLVAPGLLEQPAGIELHQGVLYVTDAGTSRFYAFDLQGKLLRQLDTGFPPGSLAGLVMGPDGKIYFVDRLSGRVFRIDPLP